MAPPLCMLPHFWQAGRLQSLPPPAHVYAGDGKQHDFLSRFFAPWAGIEVRHGGLYLTEQLSRVFASSIFGTACGTSSDFTTGAPCVCSQALLPTTFSVFPTAALPHLTANLHPAGGPSHRQRARCAGALLGAAPGQAAAGGTAVQQAWCRAAGGSEGRGGARGGQRIGGACAARPAAAAGWGVSGCWRPLAQLLLGLPLRLLATSPECFTCVFVHSLPNNCTTRAHVKSRTQRRQQQATGGGAHHNHASPRPYSRSSSSTASAKVSLLPASSPRCSSSCRAACEGLVPPPCRPS